MSEELCPKLKNPKSLENAVTKTFLFSVQKTKQVEECVIEQEKCLTILPKNNSKHHGLELVIKKEVKFSYQK